MNLLSVTIDNIKKLNNNKEIIKFYEKIMQPYLLEMEC